MNNILDELIDHGVEVALEGAKNFVGATVRRAMAPASVDATGGIPCALCDGVTRLVCRSCRRPFCVEHAELHDGTTCVCKRCFAFMWEAGKEKAKERMRQFAAQAQARAAAQAPPPTPPWEILGVKRNVSEAEIKKAYKAVVHANHPDLLPPEEREAGARKIDRATKAKTAMLAALKGAR
jgi:hypothetical protein